LSRQPLRKIPPHGDTRLGRPAPRPEAAEPRLRRGGERQPRPHQGRKVHTVSLDHVATDPEYEGTPRPDYDYTLTINADSVYSDYLPPAPPVIPEIPSTIDVGNRALVVVQDQDGVLGDHDEGDYFFAEGKRLTLTLVNLSSVELVTGAPLDGLVVTKGDEVTMRANIQPESFKPPLREPRWYYQRLKSDGTWEEWTAFGLVLNCIS